MAGLYDRIGADDRVSTHYFVAGLKGYGTGIWTRQQVLDGINSLLISSLSGDELTDYTAIADIMDGKSTSTAKMGYAMQIEAAMIAAEAEVLLEAGWRSALEIS